MFGVLNRQLSHFAGKHLLITSLGRQSEQLANDYISRYASNVCIRQQLWFNHRYKDLGLVPTGLRIKSPLNTQEAIQLVNSASRRLIRARISRFVLTRTFFLRRTHFLTKRARNFQKFGLVCYSPLLDIYIDEQIASSVANQIAASAIV